MDKEGEWGLEEDLEEKGTMSLDVEGGQSNQGKKRVPT